MDRDIPGWFKFAHWYEFVAREAPPGSTLVELGVFCAKSLVWLTGAVRHKGCKVYGVDTFLGSPEFASGVRWGDGKGDAAGWSEMPVGVLAQQSVRNLHDAGLSGAATLIVSDSAKAAEMFPDGTVFSVFVDAGHDAESVERDILAWWPKLAPGGWIAGDDYDRSFPGVREGVRRAFPGKELPPLPPDGLSCVWSAQKQT